MSLENIAALSRELGSRPGWVLAGGGNSSWKNAESLYIKPSGVALAGLRAEDLVEMDRALLRNALDFNPSLDVSAREKLVKRRIDYAVSNAPGGRRPSVEAPLHELFEQQYVLHLHPTLVNAMTCGVQGEKISRELFPDSLWLPVVDPGAALAVAARDAFAAYRKQNGHAPQLVFLQNHGVFVAGAETGEIVKIYEAMFAKLEAWCRRQGVSVEPPAAPASDPDFVRATGPVLRGLLAADGVPAAVMAVEQLELPAAPFTPDHIVYAKSFVLTAGEISAGAVDEFRKKFGYAPRMIAVPGKGVFAAGKDVKTMRTAAAFLRDGAELLRLTRAFGGPHYLDDRARSFIENWEMESYRAGVASGNAGGPLAGKIALVTGGAQGFGYGISESLIAAGAHVIVADLNFDGARKAAAQLGNNASAVAVDVSNEDSVAAMADSVIAQFGGLDLFVSNAGVLKAGSVKSLEKRAWDFVTAVNYTGYFLCVKHFAPMMAAQNAVSGGWTDIVQVNSKSGLVGSNKNAAYAAGKFGTIGMTQSFALELVADRIKVNSVCPGNYYDGPLWSDPERGLFKQYLDAGKVPGAKTIDDVKAHYLAQSPIKRGCFPADVAQAIVYACLQKFETGQAIPVTGGQVMLN